MSGMHQPVSRDASFGNHATEPLLHAIDFEDIALSGEAARLVLLGAREMARRFMPGVDSERLTPTQAVALFVDHVYWEEQSGRLLLCAEMPDRALCLPVPSAHWRVRLEDLVIH